MWKLLSAIHKFFIHLLIGSGFVGAIYTTAWAGPMLGLARVGPMLGLARVGPMLGLARVGPMLGLARVGCGLVHLHLQPRPDLNLTLYVIIAPNASSVCFTSRLEPCFKWKITYNRMLSALSFIPDLS